MQVLKKLLFIILAAGLLPGTVFAQYRPSEVPARAMSWYEAAQKTAAVPTEKAQQETLALLEKAIEKAPAFLDAYALMASIYARKRAYTKALKYFDRAYEIDSNYLLPGYYTYAQAAAGTGDFSKALRLIDRYLQVNSLTESSRKKALEWKAHFQFGLNSAQKQLPFNPVNLGDSINSPDAEYFPSLTIDGEKLIFTRNLAGHNEDFFVSHLVDSQWTKAQPLTGISFGEDGQGINSRYNEGAENISQDGKILLFTICDRRDGFGSCDIYYAVKQDAGWSAPQNIGPPINSPDWDTQPSLSPDQKNLYFVSNRRGGFGGSDIYVSHLQADGRWSKPENLGDSVNTPGNESSPFIHADNKTLYFASDGLPGVGGVDLYYARKKIDGSWSEPHNLGYPINTIDHDGSIFVSAEGKTAYFASDRKDSRGKLDIYRFTLYPAARPVMTLYVQGHVFNQKTGAPVTAKIELTSLETGKPLTTIVTDKKGAYLITLPTGKAYAFNVSKPGFLFYSANFSFQNDSVQWRPYKIDIPLQPIEANARVVLKNIFFDVDAYSLRPQSYSELNKVVKLLKQNPGLSIQINGYTDNQGSEEHNRVLSQKRAGAVVDYLKTKGISPERLTAKGFGETHPVASNATAEGRARNRRTELEVISTRQKKAQSLEQP